MSTRAGFKIEPFKVGGIVYAMTWLRIGAVWFLIGMEPAR